MILKLFLAIIFISGCFIYFRINPITMVSEVIGLLTGRRLTLKAQIQESKQKRRKNRLLDVIASSQQTLTISNKANQFPIYCTISGGGFVGGIILGALMNNPFAIPVLALGLAYLPFLIIRFLSYSYQRQLNGELETALSVITSAYQHNEDLIGVIADNVDYVKDPIREVFREFVFDVEDVNQGISNSIQIMKRKIQNTTWDQWCDTLILCQENKTMRSALTPIINRFSDVRIVSEDLAFALYDPLKELIIMSLFLIATPIFIYFASAEWFELLTTTTVGQIMIALNILVVFICLHAGIIHSKPVSYS